MIYYFAEAVMAMLFLCALSIILAASGATGKPPAPGEFAEIGVGSWNIEQFDAVGPGDRTFPTRNERHLRMIAETILETGVDVMGLQEIVSPRSKQEAYSLAQLLKELNTLEKERRGAKRTPLVWKGASWRAGGDDSHVAFIWNNETLELVGKATALTSLAKRYGKGKGIFSKEELRFPRVPLVGRFRVRAAPEHDFTLVVLHLKAMDTGIDSGLDTNDMRRRGELEDLIRKWLLKPEKDGGPADEDIIVLGDMNERSSVLVELLDEHGTGEDVGGRLILDPSDFSRQEALLLFTGAVLEPPKDFTYQGNAEKGQRSGKYVRKDDYLSPHRKFIDHILISRTLLDHWNGEFGIEYFEQSYPLEDHVHLSDHRPVSIRLRFPVGS